VCRPHHHDLLPHLQLVIRIQASEHGLFVVISMTKGRKLVVVASLPPFFRDKKKIKNASKESQKSWKITQWIFNAHLE
jgi:hypothetical protein